MTRKVENVPKGKPSGKADGADRFRSFALALPDATEGAHMGRADFRVGGHIFATLAYVAKGQGTLKLMPEQQEAFVGEMPALFEPAPGGWGRMGMTLLRLDDADDATMQGALQTCYQNVVRKQAAASTRRRKL